VAALDARGDFKEAGGLERASSAANERFEDYRALSLGTLIAGIVTGGVTAVLFAHDWNEANPERPQYQGAGSR
jgi:hypothetical protein